MTERPVSIVVEWENVRLAGAARAREMLKRLVTEIRASAPQTVEVLLVHDGRAGDAAEAERVLAASAADVRTVAAPAGSGYYELKNVGARHARGALVVFLDCDVVPERGWLEAMLAPFADPSVSVVAGATHLDPVGFWGKALALASVFPPRDDAHGVERTDRFFANSLAMRRETALAFPFPSVEGSARVSCVALAGQLAEAGVVVVQSRDARASHPAPVGIRGVAARALVHGRDTVVLANAGGPPATVGAAIGRLGQVLRAAARDRAAVGLSRAEAPLALVVVAAYYAVVGAGVVIGRVAPQRARALGL